jgi:hypothetical protein
MCTRLAAASITTQVGGPAADGMAQFDAVGDRLSKAS